MRVLQATNKEQSIRIQSSGGLSEDQIQQMVRDAESHAEADKGRKQKIEAKNEAETAVISAERSVQVSSRTECSAFCGVSFLGNDASGAGRRGRHPDHCPARFGPVWSMGNDIGTGSKRLTRRSTNSQRGQK